MGNNSSYQKIQNNEHLFKVSDVTYFDPVKGNIYLHKNGEFTLWCVENIMSADGKQFPVYIFLDELGKISIYDPEKLHSRYLKKYLESVKQNTIHELKSND